MQVVAYDNLINNNYFYLPLGTIAQKGRGEGIILRYLIYCVYIAYYYPSNNPAANIQKFFNIRKKGAI